MTTPSNFLPFRKQEPLLNTHLFQSVSLYENSTDNKIAQLPVFDPFKGILPGPAKQNLYYISSKDPARYNVTPEPRLYSENIVFSEEQVGRLWWDTSTMRYIYYEQPRDLEGQETELNNIVFRRDHWGELFPGSSIDVYEWVRSPVPPARYKGSGVPKDTVSYVEVVVPSRLTNLSTSVYYFWVKNKTVVPDVQNRTLSSLQVANILKSPKQQNFAFFSPINQEDNNNSYLFYNVQSILAYRGSAIQIQYRLEDRNVQEHTQWQLYREGDPTLLISDRYWDKMTDSLCGYTAPLAKSDEYINGILIYQDINWDVPTGPWDNFNWDGKFAGEILPVPDPALSDLEKYGIEYRPRQSMFVNIYEARKVFMQAANNILKKIPIVEQNAAWNRDVETNDYWGYTTWYAQGYENIKPTLVFQSIEEAILSLSRGFISTSDIVQVTNAQTNNRFVIYSVLENNNSLTLKEIAIDRGAIVIYDNIYLVKNNYQLSVELRQILNALRTQILINDYRVEQNELFFSMMNYVMSEQKSPDWVFKTSYIYVKENNVTFDKQPLLVPDKTRSIVGYINDAKPYHTKLRDYTTSYNTFDLAAGVNYDFRSMKINLKFGPKPLDFTQGERSYVIDARRFTEDVDQFISREDVYTVDLDNYDPEKRGYSQLFPYTFDLSSLTFNNPQTFVPANDVVGVIKGDTVLVYGKDYFVEYNQDSTYTVYFYSDPMTESLKALIWINGGKLKFIGFNASRNETALVYPEAGFQIISDTRLPANDVSEISDTPWSPKTVSPYAAWGDIWDEYTDTVVKDILEQAGGMSNIPWDCETKLTLLPNTISFRENTDFSSKTQYYRNGNSLSGYLLEDLPVPTEETENIQTIKVSVTGNILPDTRKLPAAIWIDGERIEYLKKKRLSTNVYELYEIRRATSGTAAVSHRAQVPLDTDPDILIPTKVWIERGSLFPMNSSQIVWNASIQFREDTENPPPYYMNAYYVPLGGLWYATTDQATFLKGDPGQAINQ